MALTIGESHDVLHLLEWLLHTNSPSGVQHDGNHARECAVRLADKAHKALMAGMTGGDVRRLWTEAAPRPARCQIRRAR